MKKMIITTIAYLMTAGIAHAEVAVVVSPSSGLSSMSKSEVKQIFLGKTKNFSNGKPAVPIGQSGGDATDEFNKKVLNKTPSQLKSYWSKLFFAGKGAPPQEVGDGAEIKELVSSNPNMIGYIDSNEMDESVNAVLTVK